MYKIDQDVVAIIRKKIAEGKDFSINPKLPMVSPASGYMVSIPNLKPISSSIEDVMRAAIAIDGYVGGWLDQKTGMYYLDASLHVDDLEFALKLGKFWGQKSIYDVRNDVCIDIL